MPVLAEAINVIVKDSALKTKLEGGVQRFIDLVPNSTYCSDGEIHRAGFMSPDDVGFFSDILESEGLTLLNDSYEFVDFAIVDMLTGPTTKCNWLGFSRGKYFKDLNHFTKCKEDFSIVWLLPTKGGYGIPVNSNFEYFISIPQEWNPDNALYSSNFMSTEDFNDKMIEVKSENNVTKYWNQETGELSVIGRPRFKKP